MNIIGNRLQLILARIQSIKTNNQSSKKVQLLAVSKTQPASVIREAFEVGVHLFGENYLQEALEKQSQLTDLPIEWHFIGPIQSNKTQPIAQNFSWVHSVDRLKIAQRLNDARPLDLAPLNICIQVNVDSEESKGGVAIHEVEPLAAAISTMPRLKLRGLMAIPEPSSNIDKQRSQFNKVRECYESLLSKDYALDTLSIGMSEDYPIAIEQGATIVRIGSALFGARHPKPPAA